VRCFSQEEGIDAVETLVRNPLMIAPVANKGTYEVGALNISCPLGNVLSPHSFFFSLPYLV
jgi:hypothetical protein